jgi:integrase
MTVEQETTAGKTRRRRTTAIGSGYLYEAANAFHVRYYTQEVGDDGIMRRVQKSKLLCKKDAKHPNIGCKAVRDLRQQFMAKINTQKPSAGDMPIHKFWDRFIAYCSEVRKDGTTRKRGNTVTSYESVYKRRLEQFFGKMMLSEFEPEMGTRYLDSLSAKLGLNSLRHIKAIASSCFDRAVVEGRIKINPWGSVKLPEDAITYQTEWYTLPEYEEIIQALKGRLDCQVAFAVACYCGLRKGEIEGLKWEDFEGDVLHVQRAVSRGVIGLPKTESSIAPVVVPAQARIFLQAWWEQKGKPKEGWVFPNALATAPIDLHHLAYLVIRPILNKANEDREQKMQWKNWHACRRTCATWIIENTKGNAAVAQAQGRWKSMQTVLNVYKKAISREAHRNGILEAFPEPKLLTK